MPDSQPLPDRLGPEWLVHPLLQAARGYLTDEDYTAVEATLAEAVERAKDLEALVRCKECGGMRPECVVDCPVCDVPRGHVHGRHSARDRSRALDAWRDEVTSRPASWSPEGVLDALLGSGAVVWASVHQEAIQALDEIEAVIANRQQPPCSSKLANIERILTRHASGGQL